MPGKMTAFDMDIHVPLIMSGPGIPAGLAVEEITENIDLCPTFTELAGMQNSTSIDGRTAARVLGHAVASMSYTVFYSTGPGLKRLAAIIEEIEHGAALHSLAGPCAGVRIAGSLEKLLCGS